MLITNIFILKPQQHAGIKVIRERKKQKKGKKNLDFFPQQLTWLIEKNSVS